VQLETFWEFYVEYVRMPLEILKHDMLSNTFPLGIESVVEGDMRDNNVLYKFNMTCYESKKKLP
jgi:hypothetical protein